MELAFLEYLFLYNNLCYQLLGEFTAFAVFPSSPVIMEIGSHKEVDILNMGINNKYQTSKGSVLIKVTVTANKVKFSLEV